MRKENVDKDIGNHHQWQNGAIEHIQTVSNNYSAYPGGSGGGSHPTAAGNQKATAGFIQFLNVFYHRWKNSSSPTVIDSLPSIFYM
jgi:hypothetical protein